LSNLAEWADAKDHVQEHDSAGRESAHRNDLVGDRVRTASASLDASGEDRDERDDAQDEHGVVPPLVAVPLD
jgi:hypothetical protein